MEKNYKIFELNYEAFGTVKTIYLTVLLRQDKFILIDTSYPNSLEKIEKGLQLLDLNFENCEGIFITHHDYDHMGSLAEISAKYPQIVVCSSKIQKPFIEGGSKSLRLEQAQQLFPTLSEEEKVGAKYVERLFSNVTPCKVDRILEDGEIFHLDSDVYIIDTSGHMPGHLSFYVEADKTLVAGDALAAEDGVLVIANPEMCLDIESTKKTIENLLNYDIESVICTHGGIVAGDIHQQLLNLCN